MKLSSIFAIGAVACLLATPMAASAATFSVVNDFGTSNFAYGQGDGGSSFAAFSTRDTCAVGLDCYSNGGGLRLPQILKNIGNSNFAVSTVIIPPGTVFFHPGSSSTGDDAIIRFIAPVAGLYTISGALARQDVTSNGNGTRVSIFSNVGGMYSSLFTTTIATNSYGLSTPFSGLTANLGVGDTIDFALNNRGEHFFDSTGITADLRVDTAGVPEPATWAMMIIGFGAAGSMIRRRKAVIA